MTKRRRRWIIAATVAGIILGDYACYPSLASTQGPSTNDGSNALWLRYTWYFGENHDSLGLLQHHVEAGGIKYAYFHVRGIQKDGSLKYRYPDHAKELNRSVSQAVPYVLRIAWIYAGNASGRGEVNLSDEKVRRKMVDEASWLVRTAGFEGVQWDYEICPDGDPNLLKLLDETRAALPKGAFLGVAAPVWMPPPFSGFGWSTGYFSEVARRCDQIAVMAYDTGAYSPRLYEWLVSKQVTVVGPAIYEANRKCSFIVGLPTYGDGTASHNPHAENLRLGLVGVRDGLSAQPSMLSGVGLFADYTTDEEEWATLKELWPRTIYD